MSDSIQLSQDQNDLYLEIMMWAKTHSDASLKVCEIEHSVSELHIVAFSPLEDEFNGSYLTTTLPAISNQVFLLLSNEIPDQYYHLVAQFDADSESNDMLTPGHLSPIKDDTLIQRGWFGIAILPISAAFDQFPDKSVLNGDSFEFSLLTLVSKEEYDLGIKDGIQALIAYFKENRRPLNITYPFNYPSNANNPALKKMLNEEPVASGTTDARIKNRSKSKKEHHFLDDDNSETNSNEPTVTTSQPKSKKFKTVLRLIKGWAQDTASEKEKLEDFVELTIGSVLILCGFIIGLAMFQHSVPGALAFPIFFALAGAAAIYSVIKSINN